MAGTMNDDSDLIRLFAEEDALPADETFVAGVTARLVRRKRLALAAPLGVAMLLLFAIWATWPAAFNFSGNALAGILLMADSLGAFFNSPAGMVAGGALLLTAAMWRWLHDHLRGQAF